MDGLHAWHEQDFANYVFSSFNCYFGEIDYEEVEN